MDVGGMIPRKESVESSREQRPRITSGTVIETTIIAVSIMLKPWTIHDCIVIFPTA